MKKIHFMAGLMALFFSSCAYVSMEEPETEPESAVQMVPVSLLTLAPSSVEDGNTKTMLNPDRTVSWHADDAVTYVSFENPSKLTNTFSEGLFALFEGEVPMKSMMESESFLIYPYRDDREEGSMMRKKLTSQVTGSYVIENIVLPKKQKLVKDSFGQGYNISAAVVDWNDEKPLRFRNLCSLIKVTLKGNAVIKSIGISAGAPFCGTAQLTYTGNESEPFKLQYQPVMGGNPSPEDKVILESEEGVQLTDEPRSFYFTAFSYSRSTDGVSQYAYQYWKLTITTVEGDVFEPAMNTPKGGLNHYPGGITDLGEYTVNGNMFDLPEVNCDNRRREIQVNRTQYLDYEYEVRGTESWITATKTDSGFKLELDENTGGAIREAEVEVSGPDGSIKMTVPVRQMPFGYRDLLGRYMVTNKRNNALALYLKEAEAGQEDHYIVEIVMPSDTKMKGYRPVFTMKYHGVGETLLSFPLPQVLPDYDNRKTELFGAANDGTLCMEEGNGFELAYTGTGVRHNFDYVPNGFSRNLYNKMNRLSIVVDDNVMEEIMGPEGTFDSVVMFSISEHYDGNHSGFTPRE